MSLLALFVQRLRTWRERWSAPKVEYLVRYYDRKGLR